MKTMVNCVTLIFLSFVVIFEASKIRDRFDLDAWKRASCTVAHPKLGEKFGFRDRYDQLTGIWFIGSPIRCNISYVLDASVGYRLSDGNYTGTLGLAQRHEVDFPLGAVRPAVLEDDIVDLGRVFATTGLMAISSKGEVKIVPIEMLNIFVKLNVGVRLFIILALMISLIAMAFAIISDLDAIPNIIARANIRSFLRSAVVVSWHICKTMLGQQDFKSTSWPVNLIWLQCCVAIFIVLFSLLLNFIQTDGVASQPVPEIDKVEDLVTQTTFQDVHMMIYQGLFFYQVFRDSSEGTLPKKLYNRMLTTDKPQGQWADKLDHCSFLEARYADSEHTGFTRSFIADGFQKMKKVLLMDAFIYKTLFQPISCVTNLAIMEVAHLTDDVILADYTTHFFSKSADKELKKVVNYRSAVMMESDLFSRLIFQFIEILSEALSGGEDFRRFRCFHHIRISQDTELPPSVKLDKLKNVMAVIALTLAVAALGFTCEIFAEYCRASWPTTKAQRRRLRRKRKKRQLKNADYVA